MDVVLIPAYEPDEALIGLAERLKENDFTVLVVDDGSGEKYADIFSRVQPFATVTAHVKNRGKGAALKTGMAYIQKNMPECENFITCDADGQHKVEDVVRVREQLHRGHDFVLTVRNRGKNIPLRSRVGNDLSRFVYALLANRYLSDNQSGLRGFARSHIQWLSNVEKDNYDYEMNVLYYASKRGIRITTLPIEAIYINNNASSHFNPIADTVRIYRSLFKLARGSFIALAVSEALVILASILLDHYNIEFTFQGASFLIPSVGAISCLVCILLNKFVIFKTMPCYDFFPMLIYTVIWYFIYMLGCLVVMYTVPGFPLWAAFNIVYLICMPLRFFLHKFTYIASRNR